MKIFSPLVFVLASLGLACSAATASPEDGAGTEVSASELQGAGTVGRNTYNALRALAPKVTLAMMSEDSGEACTANFRIGPAASLSAEEVLRLFGFNVQKQLAADTFSFDVRDARSKDFWQGFIEGQDDRAAAEQVATLLSGPEVIGLATMIVDDGRVLTAPAFIVVLMRDKSLVTLRSTISGMTL